MSKISRREERQRESQRESPDESQGGFLSRLGIEPVGMVIIILAALSVVGMIFS